MKRTKIEQDRFVKGRASLARGLAFPQSAWTLDFLGRFISWTLDFLGA
jgi:hypothetical protein